MPRSYLFILLGLSALLSFCSGCSTAPDYWKEAKPGQKKVLVSFAPLYCITHAVAGENAYVLCLLTSHGPHDYPYSPVDLLKVKEADLFIYNGLMLDDQFVDRLLSNNKNAALKTLNVGKQFEAVRPLPLLQGEEHVLPDGTRHKHGEYDPHIWLGPEQAILMTKIIAGKLAEMDPANKKGYDTRADQFIGELKKLEEYGKQAFKDKKHKNIVTMHESLGYFAKAFGLDIVGSIQVRPGVDPDSVSMAKLVQLSKDKHVKVFAVEPQYSAAQAETLQTNLRGHKIDIRIVQIDPLETAPAGQGNNPEPSYYLTKMRENIDTLAGALP